MYRYVADGRYDFYKHVALERIVCDIRNAQMVDTVFGKFQPEVVYHLAAITPVSYSFLAPIEVTETNYIGTMNIVHACLKYKVKHLIHASTSEFYGKQEVFPIKEDALPYPLSPYAVAKVAAEEYIRFYARCEFLPYTIIRPYNSVLLGEPVITLKNNHVEITPIESVEINSLVISASEIGQCHLSKPTRYFQHQYSGDAYEITTLGRKVKVTGDHSVLNLNDDKIKPIFARELKMGDFIAMPRKLELPEFDIEELDMIDIVDSQTTNIVLSKNGKTYKLPLDVLGKKFTPREVLLQQKRSPYAFPRYIKMNADVLWVLGLFVAEGSAGIYCDNQYHCLTISSDSQYLEKAKEILLAQFRINAQLIPPEPTRAPCLRFQSREFILLLKYLGIWGKSRQRRIPSSILQLKKDKLLSFLKGLWDGDGTKREHGFEVATSSQYMVYDLLIALARFGYYGCITRQVTKLKGKTWHSNRVTAWGIPANPTFWNGTEQIPNSNGSVKLFNDLILSKITKIKKFEYAGPVYDFEVAGDESFVTGDLILCHNTYNRSHVRKEYFVVERAITQALRYGEIKLYTPDPVRDLLDRDSHVDAYVKCLGNEKAIGEAINVGLGEGHTIGEMVDIVARLVDQRNFGSPKVKISWSMEPDRPYDIKTLICSNEKARRILGWKPLHTLESGLALAVKEWAEVLGLSTTVS
jgi:nucleoside-diphosphate-sugar epimerase